MACRSPVFPMPEAQQHYSDYGFDPQIDYFQVLEEARRHGKRSAAAGDPRSPDAVHFKLRKPISKDDRAAKSKKRRKWWKAAFLFWRRDAGAEEAVAPTEISRGSYPRRPSALSGPVYMTESYGSGSSTPCRSSDRRQASGPLRAAEVGMAGMPYLSLKELNIMEEEGGGGGGRRAGPEQGPKGRPPRAPGPQNLPA